MHDRILLLFAEEQVEARAAEVLAFEPPGEALAAGAETTAAVRSAAEALKKSWKDHGHVVMMKDLGNGKPR